MQAAASDTESHFQETERITPIQSSQQNLSAEARAEAASKLAESDRPFALTSSSKGWLENASRPLEAQATTPSATTASTSEPAVVSRQSQSESSEKPIEAERLPPSEQQSASRFVVKDRTEPELSSQDENVSPTVKQNGASVSDAPPGKPFAVGKGGQSWLQAASTAMPESLPQTESAEVNISPHPFTSALVIC